MISWMDVWMNKYSCVVTVPKTVTRQIKYKTELELLAPPSCYAIKKKEEKRKRKLHLPESRAAFR